MRSDPRTGQEHGARTGDRLKARALALNRGALLPLLLRLATPIVLAQFMQIAYQLVDTYWLARLSTRAVAAVAVTFPMTSMLVAVGGGLAVAGSTFISQHLGRGDQAMVVKTAAQTLIMTLIAGVVATAIGLALAEPVLGWLGAPPEIRPGALAFLRISFWAIVFTFLFAAAQALQRGVGDVILPMLIVSATVAMNYALAPIFIFGRGAFPGLGVAGAAWSTLLSQAFAALAGCALLFTRRFGVGLTLKAFRPDWAFIRRAAGIALPASLEQSTAALNFLVVMGLVASFGALAVATYGIGVRILIMATLPAFGLSMATATLVGQSLGAGDRARALGAVRTAMGVGVGCLGLMAGACFVFAPAIVAIFAAHDAALAAETRLYVRITALGYVFLGGNQIFLGALRGAGHTRTSMAIAMTQSWLLQLPIAYLLSKHTPLGLAGLWATTVIKEVLITGVSVTIFLRKRWLKGLPTEDDARRVEVEAATPDEEFVH